MWKKQPRKAACFFFLTAGQMMQRSAVKIQLLQRYKSTDYLHESTYSLCVTVRGEAVCRSQTDRNRWTSEGVKMCQNKQLLRPAKDHKTMLESPLAGKCVTPFQALIVN